MLIKMQVNIFKETFVGCFDSSIYHSFVQVCYCIFLMTLRLLPRALVELYAVYNWLGISNLLSFGE